MDYIYIVKAGKYSANDEVICAFMKPDDAEELAKRLGFIAAKVEKVPMYSWFFNFTGFCPREEGEDAC